MRKLKYFFHRLRADIAFDLILSAVRLYFFIAEPQIGFSISTSDGIEISASLPEMRKRGSKSRDGFSSSAVNCSDSAWDGVPYGPGE